MTNKSILVMTILLSILVGLYLVQKTAGKRTVGAPDEQLIGSGWNTHSVEKIEIYTGNKTADSMIIERDPNDTDKWNLPKTYGSRGDKKKIQAFLDSIKELKGQPRGSSSTVHKDLNLEPDRAIHIVFKDRVNQEIEHILVGKRGPKFETSFVRRSSSNDAYIATRNLLSAVGASDTDDKPKPTAFLDLEITNLDKAKITGLELKTPFSTLQFLRQEKKTEKTEQTKQYEWIQSTKGLGIRAKTSGIESIIDAIKTLKADDVADPSKVSNYGLDSTQNKAEILMGNQPPFEIRIGKSPTDKKESFYAKVSNDPQIYIISKSTLESVFRKGKDLLEFPATEGPNYPFKFYFYGRHRDFTIEVQKDKGFIITAISAPADWGKLKKFANKLYEYIPDDVATLDESSKTGLDDPIHTVLIEGKDGKLEVRIGGSIPQDQTRRYIQFTGSKHVFIISEADLGTFTPTLSEFVSYRVLDVRKDQVRSIRTTIDGKPFTLERTAEWLCKSMGYPFAALSAGVDKYIELVSDFQPKDLLNKLQVGSPEYTINYDLFDGKSLTIYLGKTVDWYWARIGEQIFQIEESTFKKYQIKIEDVRDQVLFKNRDYIESFTLKTESGDKTLPKDKAPELKVEDICKPEERATSGVDTSKSKLIIKIREGDQTRELSLTFGNNPENKKDMRYAFLEGSETVILIKEELYKSLIDFKN